MKTGIIDFIYSVEDCKRIRKLYEDNSLKELLQKAIGSKVITSKEIIDANSLDLLSMMCLNQNFTNDTSECFSVAVFIQRGLKNFKPCPLMTEDKGLNLASKTLISLSFFKPTMVRRWKKFGAPSPDYYRQISQAEFSRNGHEEIASHHQLWENFLSEHLV